MPADRHATQTGSRSKGRLQILAAAFRHAFASRQLPGPNPERILVAHHLLLGDTLMLTALFATLRARYPQAEIHTTVDPAFLPLFSGRPYGIHALPFDPRNSETVNALIREAGRGGFDLACIPGDNRHAMLALSTGARWIIAMAGDSPEWKNRLCDVEITWPSKPTSLADCFARMGGIRDPKSPGPPLRYKAGDWATPVCPPFDPPAMAYAVLHLGARSPLRQWKAANWIRLADQLMQQGITPVWSVGPGEEALIEAVNHGHYPSFPGNLTLPEMWKLLSHAAMLVCPDTGIAHMAKLIGVPTVCLFGPGSAQVFGSGEFFSDMPFFAVGAHRFTCRDQKTLFRRQIPWVRRCQRGPNECADPKCMAEILVQDVMAAVERMRKDGWLAPVLTT